MRSATDAHRSYMNWRWLIMDYVDPKLGLTWPQRRKIWWSLRTDTVSGSLRRQMYLRTIAIALIPGFCMLLVMVPVVFFARSFWHLPFIMVAMIGLMWLSMAIAGRWAFGPLVHQALRQHGYDVCIHCGYDLRGLVDDTTRCPECGTQRDTMSGKR